MISISQLAHLVHKSLETLCIKENYCIIDKVCYGAMFANEDIVGIFCVGINGAVFSIELVAWISRKVCCSKCVFACGFFAKPLQIVTRGVLRAV